MMTAQPAGGRRPHVLVLCSTGWGGRNLVVSGLLARLRSFADVTVLSNPLADNAMAEPLQGVPTSPLLQVARPRHDRWRVLLDASFARRYAIASHRTFRRWFRRHDGRARRLSHGLVELAAVAGAAGPLYRLLWQADRMRARARVRASGIPAQLHALGPDLMVSTAPVVSDEAAYALAAEALGIQTLGCVLSFDNLTSRGVQAAFTQYCVWSDRMKQELLRVGSAHVPASIHVTGTPQFDLHLRPELCATRESLLLEVGLPLRARYVLHAANSAAFTPSEPDLALALRRLMDRHPRLHDHFLVVRPHPADDLARWAPLASTPGVRLSLSRADAGGFATEAAQRRLVSSVAHADVLVTMASTMALDAAVAGTPVVCVGFALAGGSEEDRLALGCHFTTHYRPVTESGGIRLARSLEELAGYIAEYVRDPALDADGRQRLVRDVCGRVDGGAAERIADVVAALAGVRLPSGRAPDRPGAHREAVMS